MQDRIYKFRAWDKDNNKWNEYGDRLYICAQSGALLDVASQDDVGGVSENLELMQYTGLHDKNGKEIYEGDIVTWAGDARYTVIFHDGGFQIELKGYDSTPLMQRMMCEVIGNIWEHPELLK